MILGLIEFLVSLTLVILITGEGLPTDDGPIEPSVPREEVKQTPDPLPKDFEWCTVDTTDEAQVCMTMSSLFMLLADT